MRDAILIVCVVTFLGLVAYIGDLKSDETAPAPEAAPDASDLSTWPKVTLIRHIEQVEENYKAETQMLYDLLSGNTDRLSRCIRDNVRLQDQVR